VNQPPSGPYSSRPYKIALTVAVVLFFATLTVTILVILIGNAREESRETEFGLTLTAVLSEISTAEAIASTTPAPPLELGHFPFTPGAGSPHFAAAETCEQQIVAGRILDEEGSPSDVFQVLLWGDDVESQTLFTGELAALPAGEWQLILSGMTNRRLWVQISAAGRYLSAPVEIVLDADDCERNRVEIVFEQTGPLE